MTPIWFAFASGIVLGAFVTLVCVAAFMLHIANRSGSNAPDKVER